MNEDGLDLVGAGKLAKAIPQKAWIQAVDTACTVFKDCVAPLTATTSGLGRLIQAKFDKLVDAEKVIVSENFQKISEKVEKSRKPKKGTPKGVVLAGAIEGSACETDEIMRELWTNLMAQEILEGDVHPEFVAILKRMSAADAQRLAQYGQKATGPDIEKIVKLFARTIKFNVAGIELAFPEEPTDFITEHLSNLNLIYKISRRWDLTHTGKEFIKAVSDPDLPQTD